MNKRLQDILHAFVMQLDIKQNERWASWSGMIGRLKSFNPQTDPGVLRLTLAQQDARKMNADCLSTFQEIVAANCDIISGEFQAKLHEELGKYYINAMTLQNTNITALAASQNRTDRYKHIISRVWGIYETERRRCLDYLDLAIRKHNLASHPKQGENTQETEISVPSDITEPKKFQHGELKRKLAALLHRDGCKKNTTVHSAKIAKWLRELQKEGYKTTENTIRAKLSQMGYSSEKQPP